MLETSTMANDKLSADEAEQALLELASWQAVRQGDIIIALSQSFTFKNFRQAFAFMTEVALLAERLDHHPDWNNNYNKVYVKLSSHDVKGLSSRDTSMAKEIDRIIKA